MVNKKTSVLPGFKLTLGYTLLYLSLIVLIPLACTIWKTSALTWDQFWHTVTAPRVLASYRLSFGASFLAALTNLFFGLLVAWVLVRYQFWGKRFVDALVDLPFALPTAVAGIALTAVYAPHGWIGRWLAPLGIQVAFTRLGVFVALTFIGLPFIVRTVQPVLEDFDLEIEECRRQPRREPLADVLARHSAHAAAGVANRLRARVCPRARRIRLGRFHLRQHADENRDHARCSSCTKLEEFDYPGPRPLPL